MPYVFVAHTRTTLFVHFLLAIHLVSAADGIASSLSRVSCGLREAQ